MKPSAFAPLVLLALGGCAADGMAPATGVATAPAVAPAPATVMPATATSLATVPVTATPALDPTAGEIVLVEPVAPISRRGGNAALAIGASVLGAFIPGPWGGVASVATGQAGGLALSNLETKSARYHVRMSNGTIRTVTQSGPTALAVGTPVQVLTLADGTNRIVQSGVATLGTASTTL